MRSKTFLIIGVLVLAMGACNPVQQPAVVTGTPVIIPNSPTPTPLVINAPTPTSDAITMPFPIPPDLPVVSSPSLIHIAFQDTNNGWGIADNAGGYILRTVDGGTTWLNATPPGLTGIGYSTNLSMLDVNTVWVLVPNADYFTGTLYHTSDGGLTWNSVAVPFGGARIQFLDAATGRALADRGAGAGSNSVEMFHTSDGGATWLSVFNNDPTRSDSSNSLPLSGIKNGMTFLDANTGWVTGTVPMDGEVYMFVTHNGGIDWTKQSIPLPAGYQNYQYMPQAPVFFGSDGFLPLMIYLSNTPEFTFYTTHDGGTTWTGDPTNANRVVMPGIYAFADALHGWSWDGGTNLYFTTDGAQTWGGFSASLDLTGRLSQMEFVPGPAGQFTGWALTSEDNAGLSQLYKTTDNGRTWNLLLPSLSPTPRPTSIPGLSLDSLRNATYYAPFYKRTIKLVNGSYSEGSGATTYSVQMLGVYAFGDLNGDGKNDAAVILAENGGGSGTFESVVAVIDLGGAPHQTSQVALGDRVLVSSANISSGVIHLNMKVQGPNDPQCCPTQAEVQSFWLLGNDLWLMDLTSGPTGIERAINITYPGNWVDVTNPFTVSGNVPITPFENTLNYAIYLLDGKKVNEASLLVSSAGMGTPGTFSQTFNLSSAGITGLVIIQFKEVSAADGSTLAQDSVVVNLH